MQLANSTEYATFKNRYFDYYTLQSSKHSRFLPWCNSSVERVVWVTVIPIIPSYYQTHSRASGICGGLSQEVVKLLECFTACCHIL